LGRVCGTGRGPAVSTSAKKLSLVRRICIVFCGLIGIFVLQS
jgi:hypothetical protein